MKRKKFIELVSLSGGALAAASSPAFSGVTHFTKNITGQEGKGDEMKADLIIAGSGVGGCAAALGALRNGLFVIMTEETEWIGGQLTSQGVPPDEHQWIETHGATRLYRDYYRRNYPLTEEARERANLNPGDGSVSRLCHEPRVALAVIRDMMAPYISSGRLTVLTGTKPEGADVTGDRIHSLRVVSMADGSGMILTAPYFIDATELGDLLPLTGTEFVMQTHRITRLLRSVLQWIIFKERIIP
jgi:glycine/D-amino acid oxidase-like deaminating enzyme